jgi:hypothetical protein
MALPSVKVCLSVVAFNLGLLLLGVIFIELAFGNWFNPYVLPNPGLVGRFTYPQPLYEPHSTIVQVRDKYGLRGLEQPISAVQLVTVGGSTTAQTFISDGDTWQDVIHSLTGIVIANAGIDGATSKGHVEIVEDWLHAIPGLQARYFLHYVGINDAFMNQTVPLADQRDRFSWSRRMWPRSAVLQGVSKFRGWFKMMRIVGHAAAASDLTAGRDAIRVQGDHSAIAAYIERIYKPNLRILLDLHERLGDTAIFVTQPANPSMMFHKGGDLFVTLPGFEAWAAALDPVNAATQAVCRERPPNCRTIDLAGNILLEPSDFYDIVHNTPQGARKVGEFLSRHLDFIRDNSAKPE